MLKSPEKIQRQLSDATSIIGREDFPAKWPTLLNDLINHIAQSGGDFRIIQGILQTAHSLFKRYRHEFKSQELWTEIKLVLDTFAKAFTELFVKTVEVAKQQANNPQALKLIVNSLVLCCKIFYSLNAQDLPEFFEDNMAVWMQNFLELLSFNSKFLNTDTDEEPGLIEELKSQICDNLAMYASKYQEEFSPYMPNFVQIVWQLLTETGTEAKYDLVVSNAIKFLGSVADRPQNKALFEAPAVLDNMCSKVIIPNMQFRASDEEMFEDNPEEYIRRDIEGSDVDTRRRAACDLVKSLRRYFEAQITAVFGQYISTMLAQFETNPAEHWRSKDAAIYLVTSMAVKGATSRHGTSTTSELVNVIEFYLKFIITDLQRPDLEKFPVLRADALKYIVTFRNQLQLDSHILPTFPLIIEHLNASSNVVHTYAAHTVERLFTMRDQVQKVPVINLSHIQPVAGSLLQGLFAVLTKPGSTENEYVMKAIMRTLSLLQDGVLPFLQDILPKMTTKLSEVAKNPSKPHFNHYLFESLCLTIKIGCKKDPALVSSFEGLLFPVFQDILSQDVQEFMPYVFQIMSLLLELHGQHNVPEIYMQMFPFLLAPILWDRPANIQPLVRLLQAFIHKAGNQIASMAKLEPLLGVWQKLIASKSNDHNGFYLLQSILLHVDKSDLAQYIKQVFVLLFQRLTGSKTTKFVKSLLVFFSLFAHKYGAPQLAEAIDSIQSNMFGMVLERLYIAEAQKVSGPIERKICAVGMTDILCNYPEVSSGRYVSHFVNLLQSLIGLFELPEDETVPDDEHFVEIEDTPGYQASYSQLVFASKKEDDPFEGQIPDAKKYLAFSLQKLGASAPGKIPAMIQTLPPNVTPFLQQYMQLAGVTIV
ncbi:Exportin-2 [Halotydeus destructor]|nr:Exportin-2 [Halotydeus destructor]